MWIILLSGWSNSGKDTTANLLEDYTEFQTLAFAGELKKIVAQELEIPLVWTYTQVGKQRVCSNGKTVREMLIQRGQEIRAEANDPGFFAGCVAKSIRESQNYRKGFIITDWRLKVELEKLRECFPENQAKILTVRIHRVGQLESPVKDSLTEHELDNYPFDMVIENRGESIHQLLQEVLTKFAPYNFLKKRTYSQSEE